MRRISFAVMSTLAAVILLFGYRTSTPSPTSVAATTVAASGGSSTDANTTPAAPSSSPSATASATAPGTTTPSTTTPSTTTPSTTTPSTTTPGTTSATSGTVTGRSVQTRWGPVQVQLAVSSDKVTAVTVLQQPAGNGRDAEINSYALPVLKQETISAQSAHIDTVSGATVTSDGYITSLQSALDEAGL